MDKKWKMEVSNAHWFRKCHPETCCCSTNYVVHTYKVLMAVDTIEEGEQWIKNNKIEE